MHKFDDRCLGSLVLNCVDVHYPIRLDSKEDVLARNMIFIPVIELYF
jgi:hypothetical protein